MRILVYDRVFIVISVCQVLDAIEKQVIVKVVIELLVLQVLLELLYISKSFAVVVEQVVIQVREYAPY